MQKLRKSGNSYIPLFLVLRLTSNKATAITYLFFYFDIFDKHMPVLLSLWYPNYNLFM